MQYWEKLLYAIHCTVTQCKIFLTYTERCSTILELITITYQSNSQYIWLPHYVQDFFHMLNTEVCVFQSACGRSDTRACGPHTSDMCHDHTGRSCSSDDPCKQGSTSAAHQTKLTMNHTSCVSKITDQLVTDWQLAVYNTWCHCIHHISWVSEWVEFNTHSTHNNNQNQRNKITHAPATQKTHVRNFE